MTMTRMMPGTKHLPGENFPWIEAPETESLLLCKWLTLSVLGVKEVVQCVRFHSGRLLSVLYCLTGWSTRESVEGSICTADRMD